MTDSPGATVQTALEEPSRRELIQTLWPDKALYAAVLLFLTGFLGVLTWIVTEMVGLSYSMRAPSLFTQWPAWASLVLALGASGAAVAALRTRSARWAVIGCIFAFFSVGFFAVNSVLAVVALVFVHRSWKEGESDDPATQVLTADMWPDKVLAASLLLLIAGSLTVFWGIAVLLDAVTFEGYAGGSLVWGGAATIAGLFGLFASQRLYVQRSPLLSSLACLIIAAAVALWVIGPILAVAAFVLILLGLREHEFERPAKTA